MKFKIREELVNGKEYLFRGVSNNSDSSNYHYKEKNNLKSRYYAFEIFDSINNFGAVQVFELSNSARIFDYGDSSEEFCNEYDLLDMEDDILYKRYKIHKLSDMSVNGGDIELDNHDEYHAYQHIATVYLENNMSNQYDGIIWYEYMDDPETQIQIWNNKVVRKLPYKETLKVIDELKKINPDIYDNGNSFWTQKYILAKKGFDGDLLPCK